MTRLVGIDEAGRSPILGSIYFAGVAIDDTIVENMASMGLKDSKLCTWKQIRVLCRKLNRLADSIKVFEATPQTVDVWVGNRESHDPNFARGLNGLSAFAAAKLIEELEGQGYYVDSCDENGERFKRTILRYCSRNVGEDAIVAEPHADERYPVVSAASIIAYHQRKLWSKRFEERYGLSPDVLWVTPRLKTVLHEVPSSWVRRSWKSWKRYEKEMTQHQSTRDEVKTM